MDKTFELIFGEAEQVLDDRYRLYMRGIFQEFFLRGAGFLCPSFNERSLMFLEYGTWSKLKKRFEEVDPLDPEYEDILRFLSSGVEIKSLDSQSRLQLTEALRKKVHITKEVTVLGLGTKLEFWDPVQLEMFRAEQSQEKSMRDRIRKALGNV
jgi:MraZ protein